VPSPICPSWIFKPFKDWQFVDVGFGRVSGPNPYKAIPLNDRETFDRFKSADIVPRHADGMTIASHGEAVIATDQMPIANTA
jgi:hypothetical protein